MVQFIVRDTPAADDASRMDRYFVYQATLNSLAQVESARAALARCDDKTVCQRATETVELYETSAAELRRLADERGLPVPDSYEPPAAGPDVSDATASSYLAQAAALDEQQLNLFRSEAFDGTDVRLREFAAALMPRLDAEARASRRLLDAAR